MKNYNLFFVSLAVYALLCVGITSAQNQNDLPTQFDLVMLSGSDFTLSLKNTTPTGAVVDLTGYQFKSQFRAAAAPNGTLFATYSTVVTDAPNGKFRVSLSRAQTSKLSGMSGIWDLLQIDGTGKATFLLSGKAAVKPTGTVYP